MAQIPIFKLNNGQTNYYPFSVGEAMVTTHPITVTSNIGGYKAGDTIEAVTSIDQILTKLLSNSDSSSTPTAPDGSVTTTDVDVDGITIIKDSDGKLKIGEIGQEKVTGLKDAIVGLQNASTDQSNEVTALKTDVNNQIGQLKFSDSDTFNITGVMDIVNTLKDILLRLGALEQNVMIDEFAKSEDEKTNKVVCYKKKTRINNPTYFIF